MRHLLDELLLDWLLEVFDALVHLLDVLRPAWAFFALLVFLQLGALLQRFGELVLYARCFCWIPDRSHRNGIPVLGEVVVQIAALGGDCVHLSTRHLHCAYRLLSLSQVGRMLG